MVRMGPQLFSNWSRCYFRQSKRWREKMAVCGQASIGGFRPMTERGQRRDASRLGARPVLAAPARARRPARGQLHLPGLGRPDRLGGEGRLQPRRGGPRRPGLPAGAGRGRRSAATPGPRASAWRPAPTACTSSSSRSRCSRPATTDWQAWEWPGGCEDPRVVESPDGGFVCTYTAFDGKVGSLFVATSPDLRRWTKHGPAFARTPYVRLPDQVRRDPDRAEGRPPGRGAASRANTGCIGARA